MYTWWKDCLSHPGMNPDCDVASDKDGVLGLEIEVVDSSGRRYTAVFKKFGNAFATAKVVCYPFLSGTRDTVTEDHTVQDYSTTALGTQGAQGLWPGAGIVMGVSTSGYYGWVCLIGNVVGIACPDMDGNYVRGLSLVVGNNDGTRSWGDKLIGSNFVTTTYHPKPCGWLNKAYADGDTTLDAYVNFK